MGGDSTLALGRYALASLGIGLLVLGLKSVAAYLTGSIALYWRADLWPRDAPANWR